MPPAAAPASADVRTYWNEHIHDLDVSTNAPGTPGFFAYRGKRVLDVGCGAGTDLVRFAREGAIVTGVDIAPSAIDLARANFAQQGLPADLRAADGEHLPFADETFDVVFAHGVVQYTPNGRALVDECRRVLRPGGEAVFQVYNRMSWLNALSTIMKVPLEHEDAP